MIAHRLQTHTVPEPPVRVYRIIALTFLVVTIVLLAIVIFTMLKKTEIVIVAKEDSKTINVIVNAEAEKKSDKSLVATVTTTKFFWSEKYFPTATRQVDGTSKGEVVLYNTTNETQPLVKTTRVITAEGVLFRLSDRAIVPANGQVTAQVYADQPGASSDIGPSKFTIPGLNSEKQKVVYAESVKPMTGGSGKVGVIAESDFKSAESDFAEKTKAAFLQTIASSSSNFDQTIVSISQNGASSTFGIGAEASEFEISGTSTLALIMYNKNDLNEILKKEVASGIDTASEKIVSIGDSPKVTVAATDIVNSSAQLQVATEAIVTLDANAPLLNKEYFLNKQKGEIERYIVSLPHVTGMDIKFTPSWTSRTPSVGDKLKIIVKSVK
ncbi:MAG: hypothetical protein NTW66_01125 [Candidatus Magasanikbacteria bacterium]|nr:hypothetical protein [Candidatus Magasanikbacteria bacterium]